MATPAAERITLSGPPRKVSAIVRLDPGGERVVPVALKLGQGMAVYRAQIRPYGVGTSEIRLRLSRETPPGGYSGEITLAGQPTGLRVEVEPVEQVRVQPRRSKLAGAPRARVEFGIEISNGGNVPFDVPKSASIDLDDAAGQDRALGRALRATLAPGERRVDRFFEEIREGHGGEARVTVLAGAGPLEPAEARALRCRLELPEAVQAGNSYIGGWQLGNTAHAIVVEVTTTAPDIRGREAP